MKRAIEQIFTTDIWNRLRNISSRMEHIAGQPSYLIIHDKSYIKSENLRHNLSQVISQIILKLDFKDRSRPVFEAIINQYNQNNETTLTINNFIEILWVREIVNEIAIAPNIESALWGTFHPELKMKPDKVESEHQAFFNCLRIYYEKCFHEAKLVIKKNDLETILNDFSSNSIDIHYLVKIEVIHWDEAAK